MSGHTPDMTDTWTHRYTSTRRADSVARHYGRKRGGYMRVEAGLHQMGGNQLPYFSVTADAYSPGHPHSPFCCGCMHDDVLRLWPKLAPIVRLHLCDSTGAPMHAEANAWYQLAGWYEGAGERYHAGNNARHFPLPPARLDPAQSWRTTEHRLPTPEECLQAFADHVRIPIQEAHNLANAWSVFVDRDPILTTDYTRVRARMAAWIETQRPRWQLDAIIATALLDSLTAAHQEDAHP